MDCRKACHECVFYGEDDGKCNHAMSVTGDPRIECPVSLEPPEEPRDLDRLERLLKGNDLIPVRRGRHRYR